MVCIRICRPLSFDKSVIVRLMGPGAGMKSPDVEMKGER